MRIMTGAPVPRGADAVVPVEQTDGGVVRVGLTTAPRPGRTCGRRARTCTRASASCRTGTLLGPGQLALLAAAGVPECGSCRGPRVVVLSTGDELVEPGREPGSARSSTPTR